MEEEIKLTKNGCNAAIQITLLPEAQMRELGFTDHPPTHWYWNRSVWRGKDWDQSLTFDIFINKSDSTDWRIDVIDEAYGQPYDYQYYLTKPNPPKVAYLVRDKVEEYMEQLAKAGIISGHNRGDYI